MRYLKSIESRGAMGYWKSDAMFRVKRDEVFKVNCNFIFSDCYISI
jgi:hypothetical protein